MCVGAALGLSTTAGSGVLGLSAATAFNIGLGLTAANAFMGRAAARSAANEAYQTALEASEAAAENTRLRKLAISENLDERKKFAAQDVFAQNIDALQARSAIIASEQAGANLNLLLMDTERRAANYRESVDQTIESMERQYFFNMKGEDAALMSTRNRLQSNINEAYNAIPTLGQTLLDIGVQGVGMYLAASVPAGGSAAGGSAASGSSSATYLGTSTKPAASLYSA